MISKIIKYIGTNEAIFILVLLAMIPIVSFSIDLFESVVETSKIIAVTYSIAIDLAILFFILRNRVWISIGYAVASIITVLAVIYEWLEVSKILIAVILPITIGLYSHNVKSNSKKPGPKPRQ